MFIKLLIGRASEKKNAFFELRAVLINLLIKRGARNIYIKRYIAFDASN